MGPDRPKILMASTQYWGGPIQGGSQHLARSFARAGWDVAYFSSPVTPLHLFKGGRDGLAARLRVWAAGGVSDCDGWLRAFVPLTLVAPDNRPLLGSSLVLDHFHRTALPALERVAGRQGFARPDVLYLDNPYHLFWADILPHGQLVYRMADVNTGFPGFPARLAQRERDLVRRADLVLYPSQSMAQHVQSMQPKRALFLPNGVDLDLLAPAPPPPPEYARIPAPRAIYVGAMKEWFDAALVAEVAARNPGVAFVLVGPEPRSQTLRGLANVFHLGPRSSAEASALVAHAQAGIIPFNVRDFPELVNPVRPLKLFEYLAHGLPVVSTRWEEIGALDSPARLCDGAEDFSQALRAALADPPDKAGLRAFAAKHSWSAVFPALLQALRP